MYIPATIAYRLYETHAMPSEDQLVANLCTMLDAYRLVVPSRR